MSLTLVLSFLLVLGGGMMVFGLFVAGLLFREIGDCQEEVERERGLFPPPPSTPRPFDGGEDSVTVRRPLRQRLVRERRPENSLRRG